MTHLESWRWDTSFSSHGGGSQGSHVMEEAYTCLESPAPQFMHIPFSPSPPQTAKYIIIAGYLISHASRLGFIMPVQKFICLDNPAHVQMQS